MKNSLFGNHGFTIYEAIFSLAAVSILFIIVSAVNAQSAETNRLVMCKSNLKTLAIGALAYSQDHEGRYFYHRQSSYWLPPSVKVELGRWSDPDRSGAYINRGHPFESRYRWLNQQDQVPMGLAARGKSHLSGVDNRQFLAG